MGQDHIDRYIKKTLTNHSTPIDRDALWSSINSVQGKRKKKIYITSLLLGMGAVSACFLYYFLVQNDGHAHSVPVMDYTISDANTIDSKTYRTSIIQTESTSNLQAENGNYTTINPSDIKSNFSDSGRLKNVLSEDEPDNRDNSNVNIVKDDHTVNYFKTIETREKDESLKEAYNSNQESLGLSKNNAKRNIEKNLNEKISVNNSNSKIRHLSALDILQTKIKSKNIFESMRLKTTECPSFGAKKSRLFVEAYALLDYNMNSYSAPLEFDGYLEDRKSTQSYKPSYRAGIQFKYLLDNGLFIKSGIEYAQARERFRYRKETIRTEIRPDQVIHVHIDMNGDTTVVLGNAPVTIIETKNWRVKNTFTSLDIPLSVGYQIQNGAWFYAVEIGLLYRLDFNFSGMLLDTSGDPVDGSAYFSNNNKLGYTTGLTLGYRLKENLNLIARTNIRGTLGNINSDLNIVEQKISRIGLGAGIEYEF